MNEKTALLLRYSNDLFTKEVMIAGAGLATLSLVVFTLQSPRGVNKTVETLTETITNTTNNLSSTVAKASGSTASKPATTTNKLDSILKQGAKYKWKSGCTKEACIIKNGWGDCWAMSDYLYNELKKAGYKVREIQYITSESLRHRTVQILNGTTWQDLPYKKYNFDIGFRNTTGKPGMFVRRN